MDSFLQEFSASWDQLQEKLVGWVDALVTSIPNVILAAVVMGITLLMSRYVKRYVEKAVRRFSKNPTVINLLSNLGTFAFVLLGIFLILGILDLQKPLNSLLAGAGVVGLAVGLALQEPLVNIFSGVLLSMRDLYNVGDLIETNGYFGQIREITLRSTILRQLTGEEVTIPNKMVLQNPLVNFTNSKQRLLVLECGVSYGDDLEKVRKVALGAVQDVPKDKDRPVQVFFTEFGSSSINFVLRLWLPKADQLTYVETRSMVIMALKKAFDDASITIPFPIRTLDFGIKGGEKLDQQRLSVLSMKETDGTAMKETTS